MNMRKEERIGNVRLFWRQVSKYVERAPSQHWSSAQSYTYSYHYWWWKVSVQWKQHDITREVLYRSARLTTATYEMDAPCRATKEESLQFFEHAKRCLAVGLDPRTPEGILHDAEIDLGIVKD